MKKTVLITGAAKGIGRAIATLFKKEDYNVCITYNNSFNEADILKNEGIDAYKLDITNEEETETIVKTIVDKYGKIDCLVNNAGITQTKLFTDLSKQEMIKMIDTNLISMMYVTECVLKNGMISNKNGSIINISSIWGIKGGSCEVHYSASKAGVIGFTKALAQELGLSNITVNSVAPGAINTGMLGNLTYEELNEFRNLIPLNRIGSPEDIAPCVLFLASDGARYITGQTITIDGGYVC